MPYLDLAGLQRLMANLRDTFALKTHAHSAATSSAPGFMSAANVQKLAGVEASADKTLLRKITFSLPVSSWTGSGPFTAIVGDGTITTRTAVVEFVASEATQLNQVAAIDWVTSAGKMTLTTAAKPTGTLEGHMMIAEVHAGYEG